ncbi:putative redox protein [Rhodococcus sp. 27YEA15]|uniref:OsmC family protein n=1 Tax=Rhodococcus sp. 27YEA15 TaxID=3156259 RepID=UPI003C79CB57
MPQHPKGAVLEFNLTGSGPGVKQIVTLDGTSHSIVAEGHPAFGGTDSAPSPLDYALTALLSCTQITSQIVAQGTAGTELGLFTGHLTAHLDNSVLVHGAEGISNFEDVTVAITLETNLSDQDFETFTAEVERRCPITQLFRGSGVALSYSWTNASRA